MLTRTGRKFLFLGILIFLPVTFSLPSLIRTVPCWWTKILPAEGMRLGLDLQGGMYLTLKVDLPRAVQNHLDLSVADLKETLPPRQVEFGMTETVEPNHARIHFLQIIKNPQIDSIRLRYAAFCVSGLLVLLGLIAFAQIERGRANLGVDFAGGTIVQFKVEPHAPLEDVRNALALIIGVMVGTYSSIFVASPIVYMWPSRKGGRAKVPAPTGKPRT